MFTQKIAISALILLSLTACKSTGKTDDSTVGRREQLEKIQTKLAGANAEGYGKYLEALKTHSVSLQGLARLPENTPATKDLAIRQLVTSISAGALLADLPDMSEDTRTALRNTIAAAATLDETCQEAQASLADCALGKVYRDTLESRTAASSTLGLVALDAPIESEKVSLAYQTFKATLPAPITNTEDAAAETRTSLLRAETCSVSWAHSLLLAKVPPESTMSLNTVFADTMASAFPLTGISLCSDGSDQCEAVQECESDATSLVCKGMTASAILSDCGPVTPELKSALE